jgi:DNA polymerase-3 subunit alpha
MPESLIPPEYIDAETYVRHIVMKGVTERYKENLHEACMRAEYELDLIFKHGYQDYFLIANERNKYADGGGLVAGAGINSIVSYALGLSGIDPIKYKLSFETFLNDKEAITAFIDNKADALR